MSRVSVGSAQASGGSLIMSRASSRGEKMRSMGMKIDPLSPSIDSKPLPTQTEEDHELRDRIINKVDDTIFIGSHPAAKNRDLLAELDIHHVVNCAVEIPNYHEANGVHYLKLDLYDRPDPGKEDLLRVLEPTYRYISAIHKKDPNAKILIHCHAGMSRSASVAIYYLMRSKGMTLEDALTYLKERRPIVRPNDWYYKQLSDVQDLLSKKSD